jgi:hypothetical protein
LGHDSTKRVSGHVEFVSGISVLLQLLDSILDVVVDEEWLWGVKDKFWNSNVSIVSIY